MMTLSNDNVTRASIVDGLSMKTINVPEYVKLVIPRHSTDEIAVLNDEAPLKVNDDTISWSYKIEILVGNPKKRKAGATPVFIEFKMYLGFDFFLEDVWNALKGCNPSQNIIVYQTYDMSVAEELSASCFSVRGTLQSVTVLPRHCSYSDFCLDQVTPIVTLCDLSDKPVAVKNVLGSYLSIHKSLDNDVVRKFCEEARKTKNKSNKDVTEPDKWKNAVNAAYFDLQIVSARLKAPYNEPSRRLVINVVVMHVCGYLKKNFCVEHEAVPIEMKKKRTNGIIGNGTLDYEISGVPIRSVEEPMDESDEEEEGEPLDNVCNIEAKTTSTLNDGALAQFIAQLHDLLIVKVEQLQEAGATSSDSNITATAAATSSVSDITATAANSVCGFLTTGHRWLLFSLTEKSGTENKHSLKYHGLAIMKVLHSQDPNESGLFGGSEVDIDQVEVVMGALALCLQGSY